MRVALAGDALDRPITLDIPANASLDEALIQWGVKAGVELMINTSTIEHQTTHGIRGTMPAGDALSIILRDSGLTYTAHGERIRVVPAGTFVRSAQREEQPAPSATTTRAEDSQVTPLAESATPSKAQADAGIAQTDMGTKHLEIVVVTAQKRSERLQDVPSAVTALTGGELQAMGAESFTDYARSVPGLAFTDKGDGFAKPSIRGVNATIGFDTVGYYIGETPLESNAGIVVNPYLIDIARIEVLRGPQGTLYGSGSMGGTIKLIPNPPDLSKLEGSVQGTAMLTQGADGPSPGGAGVLVINVPVVEGLAGVRGVFWGRDVGGFINRTWTNSGTAGIATGPVAGKAGNLPDEHTWGFRGTGLFQPTERFDVSALIYFENKHFNGFQDITAGATNPDNRLVEDLISNVPESQDTRFTLYSITANYNFGRFNLVSSTAYSTQVIETHEEGTSAIQLFFGGPPVPTTPDAQGTSYNVTEEARLATSERLYGFDAVVGVFYSKVHSAGWFNWSSSQYNSLVAGNDPTNPSYAVDNNLFENGSIGYERQTAEFGEITYHLTDALSATAGLRHFNVANGGTGFNSGLFAGSVSPLYASTSATAQGTTHKGNISYKVSPDRLVYVQYSEGFRPGFGNNILPPSCSGPQNVPEVQPDSIKNYELGAKTMWLDKRVTVDAAVYRINWTNIQQSVLLQCGFGSNANFGSVLIKGAELEVNDQLTDRLSAGFSGGYIRAQLQQTVPLFGGFAGDQIENVPNWQFAMHVETTYPILEKDDAFARVDYQYTGHAWSNYTRLSDGTRDPFYEVNVTRLLSFKSGMRYRSWEFSLSGTNLLNQVVTQSTDPWAGTTVAIPGRPRLVVNRPRTFLINAIFKF